MDGPAFKGPRAFVYGSTLAPSGRQPWEEIEMRSFAIIAATLCAFAAPAAAKDPGLGKTSFTVYEGFLSPTQQPGEESDAPKAVAKATGLESSAPSIPREQRKSAGYGQIRFARDLSSAFVDV